MGRWSFEEDALLREVYAARGDLGTLTDKFGRTIGAAKSRAESLGLSFGRKKAWGEPEEVNLRSWHAAGWRLEQMAEAIGPNCTKGMVREKLKRMGLRSGQPRPEGEPEWPALSGSPEKRDRRFVVAVIRHAYDLGLIRAAA